MKQVGVTEQYRPELLAATIGHRLVFAQYDATGNTEEIIALDPDTGKGAVIASGLRHPQAILFSNSVFTGVLDGQQISVFDTASGKRLSQQ